MNRGGSADPCGESAAQVKQAHGCVQGKGGEGRRVADPVNPTGRLEDFRSAGVHLGRTAKHGSVLLGRLIV